MSASAKQSAPDRAYLLPGTAPAAPSASRTLAEGAGLSFLTLELPGDVAALLAVVAAHDRVTFHEFVARAAVARAEEIGLAGLLPERPEP
ncbi:hypothetical protein [Nitratireductor luteus]|uniref:hypothetical protein n=1 Tax=Nitratireductor luteus TaxID=2976980 RepID=UPI00223F5E59|nr:hypothetical protein [Nitratireductor luteus]